VILPLGGGWARKPASATSSPGGQGILAEAREEGTVVKAVIVPPAWRIGARTELRPLRRERRGGHHDANERSAARLRPVARAARQEVLKIVSLAPEVV